MDMINAVAYSELITTVAGDLRDLSMKGFSQSKNKASDHRRVEGSFAFCKAADLTIWREGFVLSSGHLIC